jgi:hypothetical protein
MSLAIDNFIFKGPFRALIAGPSGAGKSSFVLEILRNAQTCISPPPDNIVYCFSRPLAPLGIPNIQMNEGLPDLDQFDPKINNLLILDDLSEQCETNKSIMNLFCVDSHHKNISTLYLSQTLFGRNKYSRVISLNCNYLVAFSSPRDRSQFQYLARQMYPRNSHFLIEAYEDATEKKHGYLFIDLTQGQNKNLRVQANLFQDRVVYVPKK